MWQKRGRGAAMLERVVDLFYGSEEIGSMIFFERYQPKVPLREGNLLEIELVVEVPRQKRKETMRARKTLLGSITADVATTLNDTKGEPKGIKKTDNEMEDGEEDMMKIGLGSASMQGVTLDNWLQSKTPSVQELDMNPSGRYPRDFSGTVHARVSMLSQLTIGIQAPLEVVGKMKISTPGLDIRSPFKLQEYLVAREKAAREAAAKEAKKAKEREDAKAKKKADKEAKKKKQEEDRKNFAGN